MSSFSPQPRPEDLTLVELLARRAKQQPDQRAVTFLRDGETDEVALTYEELDRSARAIGAALQRWSRPGERALVLYPPGLDFVAAFFGCLYAAVAAVPAYPPHPTRLARSVPRLRATAADSRPSLALAPASLIGRVPSMLDEAPELREIRWLDPIASGGSADAWHNPGLGQDSLAIVQYTSGSTGSPRGVALTHANVVASSAMIKHGFEHTSSSRGVIWLPPYHDMGLVGGIVQPVFAGFPVVLMSPSHFLQRPIRWLEAISRYRATTSGGPNFAYDLCVRTTTPEERASLDLRSWEIAFNGSEPIRPATLDRFVEAFGPSGFRPAAFYPCYGLAEAPHHAVFHAPRADQPVVDVNPIRAQAIDRGLVQHVLGLAAVNTEHWSVGSPVQDTALTHATAPRPAAGLAT